MMLTKKYFLMSLGLWLLLLSGCKYFKKSTYEPPEEEQETYFSVSEFLDDQWKLLAGQPYMLLKVTNFNGSKDSSMVLLDSTLWQQIREPFDAADIGKVQFLEQYRFTTYKENVLNAIYINYEALYKDLYTRRLNVGMDNYNYKIQSIYIEAEKRNRTYTSIRKLTYIPQKSIRIQGFEKSIISKPEEMNVVYYFSY